jgi:hypothetical protein
MLLFVLFPLLREAVLTCSYFKKEKQTMIYLVPTWWEFSELPFQMSVIFPVYRGSKGLGGLGTLVKLAHLIAITGPSLAVRAMK